MDILIGFVFWAVVLLLAWLSSLFYSWVLSFTGLATWLSHGISGIMALVTGFSIIAVFLQGPTERKRFTLVFVGAWLLAAVCCLSAVLLHIFLLRLNLSSDDHKFWVQFGGLCFAMAVMGIVNKVMESHDTKNPK